jgi:hypothetical protein
VFAKKITFTTLQPSYVKKADVRKEVTHQPQFPLYARNAMLKVAGTGAVNAQVNFQLLAWLVQVLITLTRLLGNAGPVEKIALIVLIP